MDPEQPGVLSLPEKQRRDVAKADERFGRLAKGRCIERVDDPMTAVTPSSHRRSHQCPSHSRIPSAPPPGADPIPRDSHHDRAGRRARRSRSRVARARFDPSAVPQGRRDPPGQRWRFGRLGRIARGRLQAGHLDSARIGIGPESTAHKIIGARRLEIASARCTVVGIIRKRPVAKLGVATFELEINRSGRAVALLRENQLGQDSRIPSPCCRRCRDR